MSNSPEISICIPAYKRIEYLERLLYSISIQTFKNYEVIVTDDSPDESVEAFISDYKGIENASYYRNKITLGTPENWNEAIRKANGNWIKLMHDDDWFANENSLRIFADAIGKSKGCPFIFCAHNNIEEGSNKIISVHLDFMGKFLLERSFLNLMKRQYVGAPSNTLIRKDISLLYDNRFKWVVDFEYYIRCLRNTKCFYYIDNALVNIGINKQQVTQYTFRRPEIEIPENHLMIEKLGDNILKNIFVYDYYWRLYRNLQITDVKMIKVYYDGSLSPLLEQMIHSQKKIGSKLLRKGIVSKIFMIISYARSLTKK